MTHVRRNTILGSVLVVTLAALFSAGSDALDRPIDRERPACVFPLTQELVNQTGAQNVAELVKLGSRATLTTTVNSTGKPIDALFLIDGVRIPAKVRSFDKLNCGYRAEGKNVLLPGDEIANIQLNVLTTPNSRVFFETSKVRVGGVLQRGKQVFFFLPLEAQVADQPPPENVPVVPDPPSQPTEPSGYLGPYNFRLNNGTLIDVEMNVRQHQNHQGHVFIDGSFEDYLCRKAEGYSQIRISDAMRDSFNFQRTLPPRANLIWQDGRCTANADRSVNCKLEGTFHNIPVRGSWTARAVQGSTNIEGDGSLEINGDVLRYGLSGRLRAQF